MQYAAIVSPSGVEREELIQMLKKHHFELISKRPELEGSYDARDIQLTVFANFQSYDTIMASYEVYRVVGPEPESRKSILAFENTPFLTKFRFYSAVMYRAARNIVNFYLTLLKARLSMSW